MNKIFNMDHYAGGYSVDDIDAILDNALKVARDVVAPTNEDGDNLHAQFENGKVTVPESFKKPYFFIQENGLGSSNKDHEDPTAMPLPLLAATNEYLAAANAAMAPYYMATTGAVGLIQSFGSDTVKELFMAKMFSGEWAGTMDLTEPGGGSDVGDILTKAYPTDEPGIYKIKGTKCFITGGDQDITENIVHMTLARVEGAVSGTKGISLFVVPKFWPDANGGVGEFNDVNCVGIEHKMGLRGSATAVVAFGEENICRGYILGDAPGEDGLGQGMAQMFNMMNEERLTTGHGAMCAATVSYNNAVQYSAQRVQGRQLTNPKQGRVPIIKHEDVRRMLMFQKSHIEAFRALIFSTYYAIEVAEWSSDPEEVNKAKNTVEINTPLVKAYCSDMGFQSISEAMQVYGGYGFSEEYPIAQQLRDSRIYPIWEGTNYIQSMDLVGRKWMLGKGQAFATWLQDIQDFIDANKAVAGFERDFEILQEALNTYREIQMTMGGYLGGGKVGMIGFYATRILHATGKLYCGKLLLEQAMMANAKVAEIGAENHDYPFYAGKVAAAHFFAKNIVPEIFTTLRVIKEGDTAAQELVEEAWFV